MSDSEYHRRQAEICAALALNAANPTATDRYLQLALDHLAKSRHDDAPDLAVLGTEDGRGRPDPS